MTPRTIKKYSIVSTLSFLFPLIVSAAFKFQAFGTNYVFDTLFWIINNMVAALIGIATIMFFFGVIQYVISQGDATKLAEGRKYMLWGIIGLAVIASAWGLANLIIFTVFGETAFSIPLIGDFGGGGARDALSNCPVCLRCEDYTATPIQCGLCDTCLAKQSL